MGVLLDGLIRACLMISSRVIGRVGTRGVAGTLLRVVECRLIMCLFTVW